MMATIAVLGPLEIDGQPAALRARGARGLVELLALRTGRLVSISTISEALWDENPPLTARKGIQVHVSAVRKVVGREAIETVGQGYRLRVPPGEIDALCFEELAAEGRNCLLAGLTEQAVSQLDRAIDLWRGDPVPDLTEAEIGRAMATRLCELLLNAQEDRFDALLALGEHTSLVAELRHAVLAEPLREHRWAQLMVALYRSDRQTEALRTFQELHKRLATLGVGPSSTMKNLESAIVRNSPELDWAPPSATRTSAHEATKRSSLPAPASRFIGRLEELARASDYLVHNRLVTLTGVGGSGKTRLAIEVARRRSGLHRDGAFFVDLAALSTSSPDAVATFVGRAIGLSGENAPDGDGGVASLGTTLARLDALVVLDNCEHILWGCAEVVAELLRLCPQLRILATSREPLGIEGEQRCKSQASLFHRSTQHWLGISSTVSRSNSLSTVRAPVGWRSTSRTPTRAC
jgi:DNA-binding SARP family transcriptional activator